MTSQTPAPLRVATWNVLHGLDLRTGQVDLAAVIDHLCALAVDVVALQEVDRGLTRSHRVDQVLHIAESLGWHGAFAPALLGDPDDRWEVPGATDPDGPAYGVGLVSRWPLSAIVRTALPGGGAGRRDPGRRDPGRGAAVSRSPGWDREPRTALTATVGTPHGQMRVTATHLSYLPWRGLAQLRRAAAVADRSDRGMPSVLAGDLNLPAAVVRAALPGWSHARAATPTYPVPAPRLQVDQIAVRGGIAITEAQVGARGPSDHLPLVATIGLK